MFKFFKELLKTLKSIDARLEKLESCVVEKHPGQHGHDTSISTRQYNQ